ncbi:hypothetical protein [Chitinophaga qingshengii]|uniref:Ig-like domain-containing protein n=1 Tax=Chitinophaga qingshengii TaxID=1569794 RepID=A0ABR7TWK3_9BACT|nr:hypothetical protein [Chitinophaga qingshengii]MBC9934045.1 hypothetical protein [Chitinophaga qingshengii]
MKIATFDIRRPYHPVSLTPVLKCVFAVLLLCTTISVQAQKIKSPADLSVSDDPAKGTSTATGTTLFCKEQSGFKLTSSATDPTVTTGTPVPYTSWAWKEIDANGDPVDLPAGTFTAANEVLTVASATPGWHTYQVIASTGASECPADAVIFTVYVLPDLTVTSVVDPSTTSLKYCAANGAPTGTNAIKMNSTVTFATAPRKVKGLRDLTVDDFELTYSWSKEEVGVTGSKTEVGTDANYTVTEPAVTATGGADRKFTYSVKVTYKVKGCGDYAATTQSGSNPAVITVTPKPGKPVITIQ